MYFFISKDTFLKTISIRTVTNCFVLKNCYHIFVIQYIENWFKNVFFSKLKFTSGSSWKCRRHILLPEWTGNDDVSTFTLTNVVVTFYFRNEWEMTTSPHSLSQMFIYLFIVHIFIVSFQDFSDRVLNKYLMYISHFKRIINQF